MSNSGGQKTNIGLSLLMGFLILVGMVSCKDENPVSTDDGTTIHVNTPPDTWLEATVVEQHEYMFRMRFSWGGSDTSGEIDRYQWVRKNYELDDVIEIKNWEWQDIYCTDTIFVFAVDMIIPHYSKWKFYFRSVDGENLPDRTPATLIVDEAEILNN